NLPIFVINNKYYDKMETIRALNNSLKIGQKEAIKEVWFLFDKKLIKITRDEIYSKKYYNKLP
ncbi:MAG TPA: hypothetical protein PKE09_09510, partial [Chitinophagales bacterium]|nr:hypothetical protein [Chitinophagales bacterium]